MAQDGSDTFTRCLAAGRANFVVRCPSVRVRDAVEALFVDLADGSSTPAPSEVVLEDNGDGTMTLRIDGGSDVSGQPPNDVLASLVSAVSRLSLDADAEHLHLHCAALSLDGQGVLISAASGTGKTTLATALAQRGWSYLSDEAVAFGKDSATASGFPKPLTIKPGGRELLPGVAGSEVTLDADDERWLHVPLSALSVPILDEVAPSVIVILRRSPDGMVDGPPAITRLHPTDAVVELMGQTMDAERFGPAAAEVLAMVAARCHCVALNVGPLDEVATVLKELVGQVEPFLPARVLSAAGQGGTEWLIPRAVRSILIGDRAVLHDTSGGAIVALDEAGSGVWLALHGETPGWWQPDSLVDPGIVGFLGQLQANDLLCRSTINEPTGA